MFPVLSIGSSLSVVFLLTYCGWYGNILEKGKLMSMDGWLPPGCTEADVDRAGGSEDPPYDHESWKWLSRTCVICLTALNPTRARLCATCEPWYCWECLKVLGVGNGIECGMCGRVFCQQHVYTGKKLCVGCEQIEANAAGMELEEL